MNDISLFDFIDELEPEDIQMEVVAADLSMLLVHANCSRSQLATNLGYKKSRISRVLSGDENLTLKTLTKVTDALGYTFDVIFHNKNYDRPKQPWTIDRENKKNTTHKQTIKPKIFNLELQTGDQVVSDVLAGKESDKYIKVTEFEKDSSRYFITKSDVQSLPTMLNSKKTFTYNLVNRVSNYEY